MSASAPARPAPAVARLVKPAARQAAIGRPATSAAVGGVGLGRLIGRLVEGEDLTERDMVEAVEALMGGSVPEAQAASFLTALRMKGETVDEIVGAARVMRERATAIPDVGAGALMDTCGTGGDAAGTFNISTTAAFVLAGAGVRVAKHGNRAVSSNCGSADVLEALGVRLDVSAAVVGRCVAEVGIGFLFAPALHAAMRHVAPVRRDMGIRTIFNLLGPLTNPAGAERQLVGVYRAEVAPVLAAALGRLGSTRAMVVHGSDGLDEITITGASQVAEWVDGHVLEYEIRPEQVGMTVAPIESIRGGDAAENAGLVRSVLAGEPGPRRDVVLLNAGAALLVAGVAGDLASGVAAAAESIDSGMALEKLESLVDVTTRAAGIAAASSARVPANPPSFLERIVRDRRHRVREARRRLPVEALRDRAAGRAPALDVATRLAAWPEDRRAIIAEIKRLSPSKGPIRPGLDPADVGRAYARNGAFAISVLTEPDHFGGSPAHLAAVRDVVDVPLLYKDFVVDPYQIWEARSCGADLVLLIVAVLGEQTAEYVGFAREAGLEPLVEVHSGPELDIALAAGATAVGVNNRDLTTFTVDMAISRELLPQIPAGVMAVSESGLRGSDDLDAVARAGARAFLIGERLLTAADPGKALAEFVGGSS